MAADFDTYSLTDFKSGERVELHPGTDAWMAGDRVGTVESAGRKYVRVAMDRSGRTRRVSPELLTKINIS